MQMHSPTYDRDQTLEQAREVYFKHFGFNNGGYDDTWVRLQAGPIPIFFPNIKARVIAVRYHDLHHVVTEYPANWVGEAEIGAWEVASGCRHHWPAWILNLYAFAIGLILAPGKVYRAFMRGRQSENLYGIPFDDRLLAMTVGSVREQLHLDRHPAARRTSDVPAFVAWSVVSLVTLLLPYAIAAGVVIACL